MESSLTTHRLSEELDQQRGSLQLQLDHFRALAAYWAVPGQDKTAENVEWLPMPGRSLLNKLKQGGEEVLSHVTEVLVVLTPDVEALQDNFNLADYEGTAIRI